MPILEVKLTELEKSAILATLKSLRVRIKDHLEYAESISDTTVKLTNGKMYDRNKWIEEAKLELANLEKLKGI
jgi:hypothetical protein